jgi:hypothetical protein
MRVVGEAICSERDVAVPRLYLLGQQKSGTTTIATAFFQAGAVPMVGYHPYGNVPGYLQSMRANHSYTHLAGNVKESNLLAGVSSPTCVTPSCLGLMQQRWERKFVNFTSCAQHWGDTLLADFSTDNLPHGYRAHTLHAFYGTLASRRLILVVIMREPLKRFQSGFYWNFPPQYFRQPPQRKYAHNRTLGMELAMLRAELPPNYTSAALQWPRLVGARHLDRWVRSAYALNWQPWLAQFRPSQFVALPMQWALEDVGRATQLVAERFGVTLRRQAHILGHGARHVNIAGSGDRLNPLAHPTLEEDGNVDAQTREDLRWLADTYFVPDTEALAHMFVRAMRNGLVLGGARQSDDAQGVWRHLNASW